MLKLEIESCCPFFPYQHVNIRIALGSCQGKAGVLGSLWKGGLRAWRGHALGVGTHFPSQLNWYYQDCLRRELSTLCPIPTDILQQVDYGAL